MKATRNTTKNDDRDVSFYSKQESIKANTQEG
jgi:hypothetical protein